MIVIATNNGHHWLQTFIKSMELHGTNGHEVLVVDTHSSNPESCAYFASLKDYSGPLRVLTTQPAYKNGYEPGAYMHAFRNFPAEKYLFMHDGMRAKSAEWVTQFEERLSPQTPCVPWICFSPILMGCHKGHVEFLFNAYGNTNWPNWGIFGSMFYVTRDALLSLESRGFLNEKTLPVSKTGAEGMERGFAIAFHRAGIAANPVHSSIDLQRIHDDGYAHLQKFFVGRK